MKWIFIIGGAASVAYIGYFAWKRYGAKGALPRSGTSNVQVDTQLRGSVEQSNG